MSDDIRACFWSDEKKSWVEDGITEYIYNEATRSITFYTTAVGILVNKQELI